MAAGITKDILSAAVAKANLEFRPGHGDLLRWIENQGVPLLMFSAGITGKGRVLPGVLVILVVFRTVDVQVLLLPCECLVLFSRANLECSVSVGG